MLASPSRRVRARLAIAAGVAFLVGLTLVAATPAGAQAEPPATATTPVLDAVHRAVRTALAVRLAEAADQGCPDAAPDDADVPTMVGEIFRCRLLEAGVDEAQARQWAAEALVVSECESHWDADAVVFDGRYVDRPHPNGNRYSAAGIFQFIRATADKWVDGGYANVHDPRLNIDAAARLFVHTRAAGFRGWEDWACAAANDGFKVGSVLPGWPGGPAELPGWAWQH